MFWHRALRVFLHLIAWIFLLLVVIGSLSNHPVLRNTYFLKINLANIIPVSVPNATLINSIARTIGLHDFYQVGLWNFCEGYENTGIARCSHPQGLYYFNPVHILVNELLAGATSTLTQNLRINESSRQVANTRQSPSPPTSPPPCPSSGSSPSGCSASS